MSQFWFYLKLGLTHVLDLNAYDHILFLIVLTVAYTFKDWKRVLWLVTIFTIGHTISLVLSLYDIVHVNKKMIEFLIPLTILIMAIYNIFTAGKSAGKAKKGLLLFSALFFGLIHGLGFSNYFKPIVASQESKILPLIEFALGVELAQVIIVLVVLLISFIMQTVFRFSKRDWVMVASAIVVGMVIPMLINTKFW